MKVLHRSQRTGSRSKAVALAAFGLLAGATLLVQSTSAAPNTTPALFTPITPCRLLDTRSGMNNVGPRSTPLTAAETYVTPTWGAVGNCNVPATATALVMNVTVNSPSAKSFLTVFPADVGRPNASNLNWVAGQSSTPNAVISPVAANGNLAIYNADGTVNVIIDVSGYYQSSAVAGGARAYGHISQLDLMTGSKNVLSFQHNGVGDHCIQIDPSIPVASAIVTVTMDYADDLTNSSRIQFSEVLASGCGTNGIRIITMIYNFGDTSSTFSEGAFYFSIS